MAANPTEIPIDLAWLRKALPLKEEAKCKTWLETLHKEEVTTLGEMKTLSPETWNKLTLPGAVVDTLKKHIASTKAANAKPANAPAPKIAKVKPAKKERQPAAEITEEQMEAAKASPTVTGSIVSIKHNSFGFIKEDLPEGAEVKAEGEENSKAERGAIFVHMSGFSLDVDFTGLRRPYSRWMVGQSVEFKKIETSKGSQALFVTAVGGGPLIFPKDFKGLVDENREKAVPAVNLAEAGQPVEDDPPAEPEAIEEGWWEAAKLTARERTVAAKGETFPGKVFRFNEWSGYINSPRIDGLLLVHLSEVKLDIEWRDTTEPYSEWLQGYDVEGSKARSERQSKESFRWCSHGRCCSHGYRCYGHERN